MKISGSFDSFKSKLASINLSSMANIMADKIAERGKEIAKTKYSGKKVTVTRTKASKGKARVIATGNKIAYMEFGTGIEGQQHDYETLGKGAKKPAKTLTFVSAGQQQSTEGWQYNYRKEQGQTDKDWKGFQPQAQMFYTAQELREELGKRRK